MRGDGEAAERERRLEIVASRRRRARRARVMAAGGLAVVVFGGGMLVVANLETESGSVSGKLVLGHGPVSLTPTQQARIAPARALTTRGRGERGGPAPREHVLETPEAAASTPAPEPTYVAPEPKPTTEASPPTAEPAAPSQEEANQREFGFEH